jgi:hypothetical protein
LSDALGCNICDFEAVESYGDLRGPRISRANHSQILPYLSNIKVGVADGTVGVAEISKVPNNSAGSGRVGYPTFEVSWRGSSFDLFSKSQAPASFHISNPSLSTFLYSRFEHRIYSRPFASWARREFSSATVLTSTPSLVGSALMAEKILQTTSVEVCDLDEALHRRLQSIGLTCLFRDLGSDGWYKTPAGALRQIQYQDNMVYSWSLSGIIPGRHGCSQRCGPRDWTPWLLS